MLGVILGKMSITFYLMFTVTIKKVLSYYLHVFLCGSLAHGIVLEPIGI